MSEPFRPVDVGDKGRRAIAWFLPNGLVVEATDANVAGHAMAVVMEAIKITGGRQNPKHLRWAEELLKVFPALPDAECSTSEETRWAPSWT